MVAASNTVRGDKVGIVAGQPLYKIDGGKCRLGNNGRVMPVNEFIGSIPCDDEELRKRVQGMLFGLPAMILNNSSHVGAVPNTPEGVSHMLGRMSRAEARRTRKAMRASGRSYLAGIPRVVPTKT